MKTRLTRREFLKAGGAMVAGTFAAASAARALSAAPPPRRPPNIIYILADDLGYGDLGCYGQRKIRTPHLDRMAAEGLRFTDHYAGSAVCAPSRCVLMTGLHSGHARIRNNGAVPLQPGDTTVAEILKGKGYATALIGKWGLGDGATTGAPWKKGFDTFYGFLDQTLAHNHYPPWMFRNAAQVDIAANQDGKRGAYANDLFTREALTFVRKNQATPFFLYLAYTIPHAALLVPEDSMKEYRDKQWPETPFKGGHYAAQAAPNAARAGMITRMDRDIGTLLALLKELGLDGNTLVMFTSDNGAAPGAGGADPKFFDSSGPLRGTKFGLYEGGIRVPLIAHWPGMVPMGAVTNHVSAFWDVLPTCAELAGAGALAGSDGISFAPTLRGQTQQQKQHAYLYWELGAQQAAREGAWKAVRAGAARPLEIYDLPSDRGEQKDLAKVRPDIVTQMEQCLAAAHVDDPRWPLAPRAQAGSAVKGQTQPRE